MAEAGLKAMARTKTPKFGHFIVEFATPGIGHIMKSAGCDFTLFDLEHSGFGFETVKSALRYFEAADLPAIVRVPSREYHHIARAMDMGAEGLMLPMVGNVDEVRHIVNSMKYHPAGKRGVALQVAHDRYRPGTVADKFLAANQRTTLFCQIETEEGVKNADKMAAIEGVDCLWVGHFDLSVSLGIPGQFDHPLLVETVDRAIAKCNEHGDVPGIQTRGIAMAKFWAERGMRFVGVAAEHVFLMEKCKEAMAALRPAKAAKP